ncbi:hypothetical protein [Sodalis sp. RH22]|uniref:hypothetical protein n=1 Tax=unclassified Sodalis (in: enterobacteria) TaxID=2636512 RepID=UPI0039B58F82
MKYVDNTYPCYKDNVDDISESFAIKFCLSKNSTLRRNFQTARNDGEKLSLQYASIPDALNAVSGTKENDPPLATFMLRRTEALSDINSESDLVLIKSTLRYDLAGADYALDAAQYVYSGSLRDGFFLQQGITLDQEGRIVLVKGKQKDFFKGAWQKVMGTKKFYIATVDFKDHDDLRFDRLIVNDKGSLIGKKKGAADYYKLTLNTDSTTTTLDVNAGFDACFNISILLKKLPQAGRMPDDLCLHSHDRKTVELVFKEGSLFLAIPAQGYDHTRGRREIKLRLPLSGAVNILSACQILNRVKLTVNHNGKLNVFYLDADHVDAVKATIRHLSQKPPQNFSSGSGNNPYDKVFSGQPFTNYRWGKFSSRRIPLLAKTIDNFRVRLKRARALNYRGDRRRAGIALAQAVDPGVRCLAQTLTKKIAQPPRVAAPQTGTHAFTREFGEINKFVNNKEMNKLFASASSYLSAKEDISDKIRYTLSLLGKNESISLNKLFDASFFFGIAAAGLPFMPGWFTGAMVRYSRGQSLTLTKNDNGSIKLNYNKINYKTLIAILGTGQGLEENGKLLNYNNIDFSTVLPLEANAILVANKNAQFNFSIDVCEQEIGLLLDAIFIPQSAALHREQHLAPYFAKLIRQAITKTCRGQGATLLLEAKSELRAQVGFMADPNTFMVLPRTALGAGGAVNIFDINKQTDEVTTYFSGQPVNDRQVNLQQKYLGFSLFSYQESKIMPIAMTPAPGNTLLCFPLPLTEELKQTLPVTRNAAARHYRLDGATLKIESSPLITLPAGNAETGREQEAEPAFNLIANELNYVIAGFLKRLPKHVGDQVESLSKILKNAVDRFHGYQRIKAGEEISTFIVSPGDYKQNLRLFNQQKTAEVIIYPPAQKPFYLRLKKSLRPWTMNTTLGEYLLVKKKDPGCNAGQGQGQQLHLYDIIHAVEDYAARSNIDSLDKRSAVRAIATYTIQKKVLRQIYDEFIIALNQMMSALAADKSYDPALKRLEHLADSCSLQNAGTNPLFQLNDIQLVRQNTLASRVGTVPCTLLNVAARNELTYTASLGTIRFMYRDKEVFPHSLTLSLDILPDLWFQCPS